MMNRHVFRRSSTDLFKTTCIVCGYGWTEELTEKNGRLITNIVAMIAPHSELCTSRKAGTIKCVFCNTSLFESEIRALYDDDDAPICANCQQDMEDSFSERD